MGYGVKPIVTINRDKLADEIDGDLFDDGSSGMNEIQKIKLLEILDEINDPTRDDWDTLWDLEYPQLH